MTRTKWIVRHAKKYPFGPVFYKLTDYKKTDLVDLLPEFKKNRKFETYSELFKKLDKKFVYTEALRAKYKYKSRARYYKSTANQICDIFFDKVVDDLIKNDVEFVFNPRAKEVSQKSITIGYIKNVKDYNGYKKQKYAYVYAGTVYVLKLKWSSKTTGKYKSVNYKQGRLNRERKHQMIEQIHNGKRYYNSYKDRLFTRL